MMYIFEFEHILDREDLSNIWQNLMPKIAQNPELDEVSITHPCGIAGEFFENGEFPNSVKWMVYKVKRKAEKNYFNVTTDSQDDPRFKFEFNIESEKTTPDYSYNWPYDFFSLVELAKLDASVTLSDSGGTPGMTSQDSGHAHTYILDSNGNGYTEYAYHPGNMKVNIGTKL